MKKEFVRDIKENIEMRVKGDIYVSHEGNKLYILIIHNIALFWCRMYTIQELAGLTSSEVGRLVKDDYEKFIISQYIKCCQTGKNVIL